jgi:hypothetical protein
MKTTITVASIISVIGVLLVLNLSRSMGTNDRTISMFFEIAGMSIVQTFIGIGFSLFTKTKPYVKGVFLGLGINLLIGFAICTA